MHIHRMGLKKLGRLREYFATAGYRRPGERKLVQKLDFFILSFCCLSYFLAYLDKSNIANAYVSGMKEDLNFEGNELNEINTCFTIGYVIGQIPSNISLHYIRPRFFFPGMMFLWAGLTMLTASTHSPHSIMAIRFFQGIAESSTFVGSHYILGSWYTERELGKRSGIFTASGLAGTMIGGFIQSGIHSSMDGLQGLQGWRWLFIIDGIVTLPIAIYGLFLFPDTPATTRAFYLSPTEREMAMSRLSLLEHSNGTTDRESDSPTPNKELESQPESPPPALPSSSTTKILTLSFAKRVLCSQEWWGFVILWIIAGETESFSSNALLALYMKASPPLTSSTNTGTPEPRYTVSQLNNFPSGVAAVGIASTLFWATLTDLLGGKRYLVGYFIAITGVVTSSMILAVSQGKVGSDLFGPKETAMVFAAYYWAGTVYACQATFFAWANDVMRDPRYYDPVFRSVVLAGMNMGSNAVNAWWSIVFYGASEAPWFTRGMWAMIATSLALGLWTAGLTYTTTRTARRREAERKAVEGSDPVRDQGILRDSEEKRTAVV